MLQFKKINQSSVITYSLKIYKKGKYIKTIDVIEKDLEDGMFGNYDTENDILMLSTILNKLPKFKKFIMNHEIGHSFDKNIAQCLYRDLKDYPDMYFTESFLKFFKIHEKRYGSKIGYYKHLIQDWSYKICIWCVVMPISIIAGLSNFFIKKNKYKL